MTAVGLVRSRGLCGRGWSLVALVLCVAAVVLAGWCAITGFSVGFFYVPALVAIILAIGRTQ